MTEKKVNTQIPVIFQTIKQYQKEDLRFLKVKIWLMHTGINLNGSSFNKEVVEKALPTLANTPILAFIESNSTGEQDFSDHRIVLHRNEDGEYNFKYLGSAVGVIPETNNARWETRVTDSGDEKEYLVVDALMWNKWDEPTNIMNQKKITAQSMELSDSYSGTFDKDGIFQFESFEFFGACLLGDDVMPAMQNSTVEVQFSKNETLQNTIEQKLQEFYTLLSQEGGTEMEDNQDQDLNVTNTFETTVDEVEEVAVETDFDAALETNEVQVEATFEETNEETEVATEMTEIAPIEVVETSEHEATDAIQEFALTASQLKEQLRFELSKQTHIDRWGDSCRNHWYVDHTDGLVIFENVQEGYQLYQAPYSMNGDTVAIQLETAHKVKIEYVPFEGESVAFASNFERFEVEKAAEELELSELRSYKRQRQESDVKAKFADKLAEEEFVSVFEAMKNEDIQDVEDKLFALYGKKNFSMSSKNTNVEVNKASLILTNENEYIAPAYGGLFEKYKTN